MARYKHIERIHDAAGPLLETGETIVSAAPAIEGSDPRFRSAFYVLGVIGALIANSIWKARGVALTDRRLIVLPTSVWMGHPVAEGAVSMPRDARYVWSPGGSYATLTFGGPAEPVRLNFAKRFHEEASNIAGALASATTAENAPVEPAPVESASVEPAEPVELRPRPASDIAAGLWESH